MEGYMQKELNAESILPYILLAMTAVTGLIDAVSYLSLGHVFAANMTGNIVLLGFASMGVPGVSVGRSLTALMGFLVGAAIAAASWQTPTQSRSFVQPVQFLHLKPSSSSVRPSPQWDTRAGRRHNSFSFTPSSLLPG